MFLFVEPSRFVSINAIALAVLPTLTFFSLVVRAGAGRRRVGVGGTGVTLIAAYAHDGAKRYDANSL
jgi:hypothetical protein